MAKNGFKLIDAEMHVTEPVDLWERYIDPEFAKRAPRRLDERRWDIRTLVEGEIMAAMPGGDWPALTDAEEKALAERYAEEIARNFDPESAPVHYWDTDIRHLGRSMNVQGYRLTPPEVPRAAVRWSVSEQPVSTP